MNKPCEIVNTDQESQFTVEEFANAVIDRGCQISTGGCRAWRDIIFLLKDYGKK